MTVKSQDSYPRWKITLILRLEEFGEEGQIIRYARARASNYALKGNQPKKPLSAVRDKEAAARGIRRWTLTGDGNDPSKVEAGGPLEKRPQDEFDFVIPGIVPWEMQFGFNGFHQADTLSFKLRMADFPFDPRMMKAVGVKAYLGVVPALDAAIAQQSGKDTLLPDTWLDQKGRTRDNLRFKGWCDDVNSVWPEDDEPYTEFTCRDHTAILLDQEFPPKFAVPSLNTTPVDEAVAQLLSNFPEYEGLSVEYRPANETPPTFNTAFADNAFRPQIGPHATGAGGATGGGGKLSVWDYLVDLTHSLGHHIRIQGDTIVIQTARSALSNDYPKRDDDVYEPYTNPGDPSQSFPNRTLVYGRDLAELKISRNYTKHGPTNIQVNCYDPTNVHKVLVARYPKNIAPPGAFNPDKVINTGLGSHAHDKYAVYNVSGLKNIEAVRLVAQNIYENLGRQEIKITAKTVDLAAFGGDGTDPDMLDLQPGDTVTLLMRKSDSENFQTFIEINDAMDNGARAVTFLKNLGYEVPFAQKYTEQFQKSGFSLTEFRVKAVGIQCGDDGVTLDIELMNYISVRADLVQKKQESDALQDWKQTQKQLASNPQQQNPPASPETSLQKTVQADPGLTDAQKAKLATVPDSTIKSLQASGYTNSQIANLNPIAPQSSTITATQNQSLLDQGYTQDQIDFALKTNFPLPVK